MVLQRTSKSSERFRESALLLPSDVRTKKPTRFFSVTMRWPVAFGVPILLLLLGIALEIALAISSKRGGFRVPERNALNIFSPQFLLAFFPTIIVAPFAIVWREVDWDLRWVQPYIILWRGKATAEESLLLDYIALGPVLALFRALKYKHRILFWSSISAIVTYIFQPLAGSIFQLRQKKEIQLVSGLVTNKNVIGVDQNAGQLDAFVASAGFVQAAAYNGLPDPPFIHGGWATSEFSFPTDPGLNGTMSVNTTGIQTNSTCANPFETIPSQISPTSLSVVSKSVGGCTVNITYDPNDSETQFGVVDVPCPGDAATADISFRPIMFWYALNNINGQQVKTIFCAPRIQAFRVTASASLNDRSLYSVVKLNDQSGDIGKPLRDSPLNGQAYNGVLFPNNTNRFIQARSLSTRSALPGAIFRFASQLENGPQSVFDHPNGFLNITNQIYTQHLSLVAKSVYLVNAPANETLSAELTSIISILWIDPIPGHFLALFLIFTGITGLIVQFFHQRNLRKLLLVSPPGSIAAIMSLTSSSGFGHLLSPFDDEATLERKLEGLRFRTDRRTGAIAVDNSNTERVAMGPNDAMLSLLGHGQPRDTSSSFSSHHTNKPLLEDGSSSELAYRTALGYPPWNGPRDT